jgi:1-acyl-sn-glycerol-3-phosphate acyltransferase
LSSRLFTACNAAFKTTLRMFARRDIQGSENIPAHGPVIFIANHLSNLDPPIVASVTGRKPGFLAKQELFKLKIASCFLNAYGAHPLKRGTSDIGALRWAAQRLRQPDGALIIFPEGTRNKKADGMGKALPGVTQLALMTGAPVVPIGLYGSQPLQSMLKLFVPRAKLRIRIGKPVELITTGDKRPTRDEIEAMTTELMVRVANLLPDSQYGYYRKKVDIPFAYTRELDTT